MDPIYTVLPHCVTEELTHHIAGNFQGAKLMRCSTAICNLKFSRLHFHLSLLCKNFKWKFLSPQKFWLSGEKGASECTEKLLWFFGGFQDKVLIQGLIRYIILLGLPKAKAETRWAKQSIVFKDWRNPKER